MIKKEGKKLGRKHGKEGVEEEEEEAKKKLESARLNKVAKCCGDKTQAETRYRIIGWEKLANLAS